MLICSFDSRVGGLEVTTGVREGPILPQLKLSTVLSKLLKYLPKETGEREKAQGRQTTEIQPCACQRLLLKWPDVAGSRRMMRGGGLAGLVLGEGEDGN